MDYNSQDQSQTVEIRNALAEPVFYDLLGHDFSPNQLRILLAIWKESLDRGKLQAQFPVLFASALGIRNRDAKAILSALERMAVLSWDPTTKTAAILPRSASRPWAVTRRAYGHLPPEDAQKELLPTERPLSTALVEVATDEAMAHQATPPSCPPAAANTLLAAAASRRALAKAQEAIPKALAKAQEAGGRQRLEDLMRIEQKVRETVGQRDWDKWGRQWQANVSRWPSYFERLVSDCRAKQALGMVTNAGGWMSRIARDEGKWGTVQTPARI